MNRTEYNQSGGHRLLCLFMIMLQFYSSWSLLENLEDPDSQALKTRLEEEKANRMLLQNDVEIMMTKIARLERKSHGAGSSDATRCPSGWIAFEESCYLFADEIKVNWIEATHYCASFGDTHVTTIESMSEQMFLAFQANKLFKNGVNRSGISFWLGATDLEVHGIWTWYTNRKRVRDGYNNWKSGQGDSSRQHCAVLWGSDSFTWHDHSCTHKGHVICEKNN